MRGYVGLVEVLLEKGVKVNVVVFEYDGWIVFEGVGEYGWLDMV